MFRYSSFKFGLKLLSFYLIGNRSIFSIIDLKNISAFGTLKFFHILLY